jgi:RNA polymerase sigma factor (TIGR02999 family)
MSNVTGLLSRIEAGDPQAAEQLLPLVYGKLRNLAAAKLAQEKPGQTLQATALVHEAYLRLVADNETNVQKWENRRHFFAAAAQAMRRILVEAARRKKTFKRGSDEKRVDFDIADLPITDETLDLIALDEALSKFAVQQPLKADLVKLRFFAGLTMQQAADALGISLATAERYWTFARAWLFAELSGEGPAGKKSSEK